MIEEESIKQLIRSSNQDDVKLGVILALRNYDVSFWERITNKKLSTGNWKSVELAERYYIKPFQILSRVNGYILVQAGYGQIEWCNNPHYIITYLNVSDNEGIETIYL